MNFSFSHTISFVLNGLLQAFAAAMLAFNLPALESLLTLRSCVLAISAQNILSLRIADFGSLQSLRLQSEMRVL